MAAGLLPHVQRDHHPVGGQRPGVVGHHQRAAGRQVLGARGADAPVHAVQRAQQRQQHVLGEVDVEAEVVDLVVAGHPAAQERGDVGDAVQPLLAEDVAQPLQHVDAAGRRRHGVGLGRGRRGLLEQLDGVGAAQPLLDGVVAARAAVDDRGAARAAGAGGALGGDVDDLGVGALLGGRGHARPPRRAATKRSWPRRAMKSYSSCSHRPTSSRSTSPWMRRRETKSSNASRTS